VLFAVAELLVHNNIAAVGLPNQIIASAPAGAPMDRRGALATAKDRKEWREITGLNVPYGPGVLMMMTNGR